MNISEEEWEATQERLNELEALLTKILDGPRTIATVEAGPHEELYRVENGNSVLIVPANPAIDGVIPVGRVVVITNNTIHSVLPDELDKKPEIPDFKFLEWNEIGGLDSQVGRIREAIENPIKYREIYEKFNLPPVKGLLLAGAPGLGKTMIAKAIATSMLKNLEEPDIHSFMYFKGGEMLYSYVGQAEQNIKNIFDSARKHYKKTGHRSVVFIDEAEAIMPIRGSRVSSDVDKTIVPTFLAEMDGFEGDGPFIILATNHPNQLDPAIIRPGRIDLKITIDRPSVSDAIDIFKIYYNKTKTAEDVEDLARFSAKNLFLVEGMQKLISGAYIADFVHKTTADAIKRLIANNKSPQGITIEDVKSTLEYYSVK